MSIHQKLLKVQSKLEVPKNHYNDFGGYHYRNCEDILEAVKPLLEEENLLMTISDELHEYNGDNYVKATVKIVDTDNEESIETSALARETKDRKKMNPPQLTGSASSYARKYALNGMFAINDVKDADATNTKSKKKRDNNKSNKPDNWSEDHKKIISEYKNNTAKAKPIIKQFFKERNMEISKLKDFKKLSEGQAKKLYEEIEEGK